MGQSAAAFEWDSPEHAELWVLAVVFFGVGDLLTTGIGIRAAGVIEANPLLAPIVEEGAVLALGATKLLALGGCYAVWLAIPRPHRVGVPLALATVGVAVTAWNLQVLLRVDVPQVISMLLQ